MVQAIEVPGAESLCRVLHHQAVAGYCRSHCHICWEESAGVAWVLKGLPCGAVQEYRRSTRAVTLADCQM